MLDKVKLIKENFKKVEEELSNPDVFSDNKKYATLSKKYKELKPLVEKATEYENLIERQTEAKEIIKNESDEELVELAKEELKEIEEKLPQVEEELKLMLVPKDPDDDKNIILEIRAGTGGDEASLFAGDLLRMYQRYAEKQGWDFKITDFTPGTVGGYKEVIVNISGEDCYGKLKYESGVHRVQRVPKTETQGRIHTSAASVVVLPEPEEIDVKIDMKDIKKETFCASGHGGQSVNTTYSAVRLTHIPTGIVVSMQNERSQIQNYELAMKVLKARLYELEMRKKQDEETKLRRSMVSSGDRSVKIRTYNFPNNRLTDHRIGLTLYNLSEILEGELEPVVEALRLADRTRKLEELEKQES